MTRIPEPRNTLPLHEALNDGEADDVTTYSKSVTWAAELNQYRDCPRNYDSVDSDIWYKKNDYTAFKKECEATCRLAKEGLLTPDLKNNLCERGLEHRFNLDRLEKRLMLKCDSRFAVFVEQLDQQEEDVYYPDRLREAYEELSAVALKDAQLTGLQDQQEANFINCQKQESGQTGDSLMKLFGFDTFATRNTIKSFLGAPSFLRQQDGGKRVAAPIA